MVQTQFGVHFLQASVLLFQLFEASLAFILLDGDLLFLLVEGRWTDWVFSADRLDRLARIVLGQNRQALLFGEFALAHRTLF